MADARDYGIVQTTLQGSGLGYFGESSGYAFPTEESDRVPRTGHRNVVHQGSGIGDDG